MDEYYALDAEDFIDDVPCRFKYKEVAPSMYGLTTKEILSMSDKQLTQIVPLKKLAPYRHDADFVTAPKEKMRSQRMAREFLTEAAKRGGKGTGGRKDGKKMTARERKGKGKKEGDGGGVDAADPEAAAAAAAADRVASYGARAWGKYNIDKKGKKKSSNGTSAADDEKEGKEATRKDDGDTDKKRKADRLSVDAEGKEATIKPGTGKNAKKNLKKRQKRNELEKAKAAGML
jgi:protein KRI1